MIANSEGGSGMSRSKPVLLASLITILFGVSVSGSPLKTTNWRVETQIDVRDPAVRDTSIESHPAPAGRSQEKVDKLVGQLKEQLAKRVPSVFYDNPPWAGIIRVQAVVRQPVSLKESSLDQSFRATNVSDTLHSKGRLPSTEGDLEKQKRVDELKFKTEDPQIIGLRIQILDLANRELRSGWYPANSSSKIDMKQCVSEISAVMSQVASQPETATFQERK